MIMNRKIRIGQLGVSHEHAASKMKTLRQLPEYFEVVGVVDDRASAAAKFPSDDLTPYDGLNWMAEAELFSITDLHAVIVETPNLDLVPAALRCLERGLPIHMDKPGGEDVASFRHLRHSYESQNLAFQMGYMLRHNPALVWIMNAVRQKWLGEILEIQADMSHDYGGQAYQQYLGQFRGGIMFNLGCHLIDWVVALLGRPLRVTPILQSTPDCSDSIKNNCTTVLEYAHTTVTLRACSKVVDGLRRRRFKLCGTNGSVELCPMERFDGQPLRMNLVLKDAIPGYASGANVIDFGVVRDRYEDQLLELAKLIRGPITTAYTCEHDCLVHEVLLAASGYTVWRT
jgi:predicted dehydrogenase